jgi:hypothetical protein
MSFATKCLLSVIFSQEWFMKYCYCFSGQTHKLFSAFELTVFVLVKKNGIYLTDFNVTIIKFHQNAVKRFTDETCGHTVLYNLTNMWPFSCAKNAHGMASEGKILTLGSMRGILYGDTNWNRRCGTKVRLVLQKKEILLNNRVHKNFFDNFQVRF